MEIIILETFLYMCVRACPTMCFSNYLHSNISEQHSKALASWK